MKHLRYSAVLVLMVVALVAAGCGPSSASNSNNNAAGNNGAAATTAPAGTVPTVAPVSTTAAGLTGGVTSTTQTTATTTTGGLTATTAPTATQATTTTGVGAATAATATVAITTTSTVAGNPAAGTYGDLKVIPVEPNAHIVFSGWGDQTEQQVYRDSLARFKQFYPNVTVDYQPIPSDFQTKLKAAMAGGTAPDVFYVDDQLMNAFGSTGQLMQLDSYMAQAGATRDGFIPQLLTIFTLNGKTYGLPKDWGTLGLIYLPEAFKAAGIAEPTANWTWSDLQKAADAIAKNGKYKGFCMAADYARLAPFVLQDGGFYVSNDYKQATMNTTAVKDATNLIATMKQNGSLVTPADVGASWCGEAVGKQLVAMTYEGGWMVNFMRQSYSSVNWNAVPLPAGPKGQADFIFTNAIGVNAHTKYPKAAAALAIFLTSRYNQAAIVQTGFAYSTHSDQVNLIQNPKDKAIATGGTWKASRVDYMGPNSGNVRTAISKALERIFLGAQTVDESLTQAQSEVQAALNGQ